MPEPMERIFAAANELPEIERFELIYRLLKTLSPDAGSLTSEDHALEAELQRRIAEQFGGHPWDPPEEE